MSNMRIKPVPVRKQVFVAVEPERAFAVFTGHMGVWWPKGHSVGSSPQKDVVVEPRTGGRWFERAEDGSESMWGHVIAWDPPHRVLLAWQLNAEWTYDPALVTVVEVRFDAHDGGTMVHLEHSGLERMGDAAEAVRKSIDSPDGWGGILASYATAVTV
jgi:uncharacterized protein YndB with AHSA1/START domain